MVAVTQVSTSEQALSKHLASCTVVDIDVPAQRYRYDGPDTRVQQALGSFKTANNRLTYGKN